MPTKEERATVQDTANVMGTSGSSMAVVTCSPDSIQHTFGSTRPCSCAGTPSARVCDSWTRRLQPLLSFRHSMTSLAGFSAQGADILNCALVEAKAFHPGECAGLQLRGTDTCHTNAKRKLKTVSR